MNMLNNLSNKLSSNIKVLSAALALTLGSQLSLANVDVQSTEDSVQKGMEISLKTKTVDQGWQDFTADMLMVLRNAQGQESVREVKMKSLEQLEDGDKSLTVFNKPKDVKGTAFLSYSHAVGPDDQWLYLPSLKRVKRIASNNKSGPFMGSEFSFEDLSSFEINKYTYNYLGDEKLNDRNGELDTFKVEQVPTDKASGYSKRIVWIDKDEYRIVKVEFYDRKKSLLKTLSYQNFKLYLGKYWRANNSKMVNHQSGKETELQWNNYSFQTGLSESDFNKSALKRRN